MVEAETRSIGRYQVIDKLGEGGMAVVYKCYDPQLDRLVAVKMMRTSLIGEKMRQRFDREARALGQLGHPHIVKVLDYGELEGNPYLVMEYIEGGQTLKDLMGKALPVEQVARLLLPVAEALAYAHRQHIIHRDIKPGNVLITKGGEVKLADFGIAKMEEGGKDATGLTGTGEAVGTPEYMAPEQIIGGEVTERADIYALGIVLYEMLSGKKPYGGNTPMEIMLEKLRKEVPRLRDDLPGAPLEAERLVRAATAKEASERLESAEMFAEGLRRLLESDVTMTAPVRHKLQRAVLIRKFIGWLIVIGLFTLIGIVIGFRSVGEKTVNEPMAILPEPSRTGMVTSTPTPLFEIFASPAPTFTLTPTPQELDNPSPSPVATLTVMPTKGILRPVIQESNLQEIELLHAINLPLYQWPEVTYSADGNLMAMVFTTGLLQVWDLTEWETVFRANLPEKKDLEVYRNFDTDFLFSPDGHEAVMMVEHGFEVRRVNDWTIRLQLLDPEADPINFSLSPNGQYLAGLFVPANWDPETLDETQVEHLVRLWSIQEGYLMHEITVVGDVTYLQFSPDSQLLIIPTNYSAFSNLLNSGYNRDYMRFATSLLVFRAGDGGYKARLDDEYLGVFSADSHFYAGKYLWDLSGCTKEIDICGRQIGQLRSPGYRFDSQKTFYDENHLFTTLGRIWDTQTGKVFYTIEEVSRFRDSVFVSNQNLLVIETDNELVFYDLQRFYSLFSLPEVNFGSIGYFGRNLSPDETLLATRQSELLRVRRVSDGGLLYTFDNVPDVLGLEFSPDGRYLIVMNQPTQSIVAVSFWGLPLQQDQ